LLLAMDWSKRALFGRGEFPAEDVLLRICADFVADLMAF
jgi:hypothetical protein